MTLSAVTPTLNTTIDMQGVDTIIAMPEWYVNFNLAQLLQNGRTIDGGSLQDVSLAVDGNLWLKGTVGSLSTSFAVEGSVSKVVFVVSFDAGTMEYYDITTDPPTKRSADISGLAFGFLVDLSVKDLEDDANVPADVREKVKARMSNVGAGAFTIQQFFMDLTEGAISSPDPAVTRFPAGFPASAKAALPTYLTVYVDQVTQAGGHVLGYGVKVQNPGDVPDPTASFPPTALQLVTNEYEGSGGADGSSDLDTINYLMMTGPDPVFPANLKPWWGNFVQPGDDSHGVDGVCAVRAGLFRAFLLERLAPIVCAYVEVENRKDSTDLKTRAKTGTFTPTALGGTFRVSTSGTSHRTNTLSNDDAAYAFTFDVTLAEVPGQPTITIERRTRFSVKVTHWYGVEHHAVKSEFEVDYEIPVTYTVTLVGVDDGGLQVTVDEKTKQPDPNTVYADPYGWLITGTKGEWTVWQDVSSTWGSVIDSAVGLAVPAAAPDSMTATIASALDVSPFFFPGGAQLFMKDPVLSDAGDLLVGLQYKG